MGPTRAELAPLEHSWHHLYRTRPNQGVPVPVWGECGKGDRAILPSQEDPHAFNHTLNQHEDGDAEQVRDGRDEDHNEARRDPR